MTKWTVQQEQTYAVSTQTQITHPKIHPLDNPRCGSSLSVYGALGCSSVHRLSIVEYTSLGSTLSVRAMHARGAIHLGKGVSFMNFGHLGSTLSVRTMGRSFGLRSSVYDFLSLGSSVSLRGFVKLGSSVSIHCEHSTSQAATCWHKVRAMSSSVVRLCPRRTICKKMSFRFGQQAGAPSSYADHSYTVSFQIFYTNQLFHSISSQTPPQTGVSVLCRFPLCGGV